jgi:hypothetical protein
MWKDTSVLKFLASKIKQEEEKKKRKEKRKQKKKKTKEKSRKTTSYLKEQDWRFAI